jgi:hypothetical protein
VFLVAIRLQPEKMVAVICIMVIATSGKANNFKARVSFYLPSPLLMPPSTYIYPLFSLRFKRRKNKLLRMKEALGG